VLYEDKDNDVSAYHEGVVPLFLKLVLWYGREGGVVSFMLQPQYPWGRSIQHPLNRKLGVPLLGIKPWFLRYPSLQPSQ